MADLTTKEAAARLNCATSHLENLRLNHPAISPPFYRLGKLVRYPVDRLEAWIAAQIAAQIEGSAPA